MNDAALWFIVSFLITYAFFMILYFVRGGWVYRQRLSQIDKSLVECKKLPSYGVMIAKFWIWDIEKFKKS